VEFTHDWLFAFVVPSLSLSNNTIVPQSSPL